MLPEEIRNIKSGFFMLQLSLLCSFCWFVLWLSCCFFVVVVVLLLCFVGSFDVVCCLWFFLWFVVVSLVDFCLFACLFVCGHTPRLLYQGSVSKRNRHPAKVLIGWTLMLLSAATLYYFCSHTKILRNRNYITDRWNCFCLRTDAFYTVFI